MSAQEVHVLTALAWEAALPVACEISAENENKLETGAPRICYFLAPRQGYLFFAVGEVINSFRKAITGPHTRIWFTFSKPRDTDKPAAPTPRAGGRARGPTIAARPPAQEAEAEQIFVPWQFPLGVALDRIAASVSTPTKGVSAMDLIDPALPLTVHFSDNAEACPADHLVMRAADLEGEGKVHCAQQHKAFLTAIVETTKPFYSLSKEHTIQLSQSIRTNDVRSFFEARTALVNGAKRQSAFDNTVLVLHVNGRATTVVVDNGDKSTLGYVLRHALPFCSVLTEDECLGTDRLDPQIATVHILGTEPPLCTPTVFLRDNLCGPAMHVHLVISGHMKKREGPPPKLSSAPPALQSGGGVSASGRFDPNSAPTGGGIAGRVPETPLGPDKPGSPDRGNFSVSTAWGATSTTFVPRSVSIEPANPGSPGSPDGSFGSSAIVTPAGGATGATPAAPPAADAPTANPSLLSMITSEATAGNDSVGLGPSAASIPDPAPAAKAEDKRERTASRGESPGSLVEPPRRKKIDPDEEGTPDKTEATPAAPAAAPPEAPINTTDAAESPAADAPTAEASRGDDGAPGLVWSPSSVSDPASPPDAGATSADEPKGTEGTGAAPVDATSASRPRSMTYSEI